MRPRRRPPVPLNDRRLVGVAVWEDACVALAEFSVDVGANRRKSNASYVLLWKPDPGTEAERRMSELGFTHVKHNEKTHASEFVAVLATALPRGERTRPPVRRAADRVVASPHGAILVSERLPSDWITSNPPAWQSHTRGLVEGRAWA